MDVCYSPGHFTLGAFPNLPTEDHPPCKDGKTGRPTTKFICGNSNSSFACPVALLVSHYCFHPSLSSVMGHPALRSVNVRVRLADARRAKEIRPVGTCEPDKYSKAVSQEDYYNKSRAGHDIYLRTCESEHWPSLADQHRLLSRAHTVPVISIVHDELPLVSPAARCSGRSRQRCVLFLDQCQHQWRRRFRRRDRVPSQNGQSRVCAHRYRRTVQRQLGRLVDSPDRWDFHGFHLVR